MREIKKIGTKLHLGHVSAKDDMLAIEDAVEAVDSDALRAEYVYLMGVVEYRFGNYSTAKQQFERAAILGETSGHDRIRALALAAIGGSRELGYEEALGYMQRAQAVLKRVNGSGDFRADIELLVSALHRRHGKWQEARTALEHAKVTIEAGDPVNEAKLADVYRELSRSSRDPVVNEKNAREALRLDRAVYGEESVQTVASMVALAETTRWIGKIEDAETMLRSAVVLHRKVYGEDHNDSVTLHTNLCVTITDVVIGKSPASPDKDGLLRAEHHCKEAIRIGTLHVVETKAETMKGLATAHSGLGRLYNASRRFEEGLVQYELAFDLGTKAKNRPDDMTSISVGLASCLAELERDLPRALYLLEETQEVYRETMGPQMAVGLDQFIECLREHVPVMDRLKRGQTE
ncbi:MAG: tetratricopeptide repeat protein [Kofleriaceae bacterium]|nr:tetratricopeptide repeat protein [Kofleriaceae bacterium]